MVSKSSGSNFKLRLMSTILLLPALIWISIGGGFLYLLLLLLIAFLAAKEWAYICGKWSLGFDGMLMITFICLAVTSFYMKHISLGLIFIVIGIYTSYFSAKLRAKHEHKSELEPNYLNRPLFLSIGCGYLGLALGGLAYLRNLDYYNIATLWVFGLVVCSDISAYAFGSLLKGKKLAPKISPGKTWSGLIAAILTTFIISYIIAHILKLPNQLSLSIFGAIVAVVAHIGDLLQSALKRYLKVKDSGNLIPGHGGILDRIDALLLVSIMTFLIVVITHKSILLI